MINLNFPIQLKFHIATLSNDFTATDANGKVIAYTRQKLFKLKEHIQIFGDSSKKDVLFEIKANQWLDFNASYMIQDPDGKLFGRLSRKGMRSFWKATYLVWDADEQDSYVLSEENPFTKFVDSFVGEIPVLGWFTGYILNPSYVAKNKQGEVVLRLKKNPSFFGRKFTLDKVSAFDPKDESLLVLSFMMMVLLERKRG